MTKYTSEIRGKVSVVIPVFNRTEELKRAINSVLSQTYTNWEIWVVDDCSTENILSIVNQFENSKIFYKRSDRKGNANICRNIGIKNSTGEFIAMLDSDDEWLPDHLERSVESLKKLQVDGIFGSFYVDSGESIKPFLNRPLKPEENMVNYILDGNSTQTSTHFYYKDKIESVLWDEKLHRNQDYDLVIRFSDKYKIAVVHLLTVVVHWRQGEKRMYHFPSHRLFIERYFDRMVIKNFIRINMENCSVLINTKTNNEELNFFKNNILRNIKHLSFIDYMSCFASNKGILHRMFLRISYLLRILIS